MPNPQIKLKPKIYNQLNQLRDRGQTFSLVIQDLLSARLSTLEFINLVEGTLRFSQWQYQRLHQLELANPSPTKSKREVKP